MAKHGNNTATPKRPKWFILFYTYVLQRDRLVFTAGLKRQEDRHDILPHLFSKLPSRRLDTILELLGSGQLWNVFPRRFLTRNGFWKDVTSIVVDIFFRRSSPKARFFDSDKFSNSSKKFLFRLSVGAHTFKSPEKWIKQAAEKIRINPLKRSQTTTRVETRSW